MGSDHDAKETQTQRATALVIQNGNYLLVRDKGRSRYSLPGGGIDRGEAALTAACRELAEELSLRAYKAERLFDYDSPGSFNIHKVVLVHVGGKVKMDRKELDAYLWWDGSERDGIEVFPSVKAIISRYERGDARER